VRQYRAYYAKQGMFEYSLYNGIEELIKTLRAQSKILAVATTKYRKYALLMLQESKLLSYFDYVAGSNEDGSNAGKNELLAEVMKNTACSAAQCVMIGDKHHDGQGAAHYHIDFIWAKYGYGQQSEMKDIPIKLVAENVNDIYRYLAEEDKIRNIAENER